MSARKLWKVTYPNGAIHRPESQAKAYSIYVANARAAHARNGTAGRYVDIHVDERDGQGWQLYERIDLTEGVAW